MAGASLFSCSSESLHHHLVSSTRPGHVHSGLNVTLMAGCHHFLFSLLVQYLISSRSHHISAGRTCAYHRRALLTVLSHSKSRLLLSHLGYQAWMIKERLPALFCSHQTALGRSLFREFSQFPDCHWARGRQIKSYINMINSIVSPCILNAWGF